MCAFALRRAGSAGTPVGASSDDPQYEVRSEKSHGTAVHRPSALQQD
jgi:Hypervirulence associated proteins TUDOR domain